MNIKTPSPLNSQQQAVADWVATGTGSLNLVARAGTGKTYALLHAVVRTIIERDRPGEDIRLMAFNKAISDEIKAKVAVLAQGDPRWGDWKRLQVGTVHSFGFSAIRKVWPKVKVDEKKVLGLIDRHAERNPESLWATCSSALARAVSLGKQSGCGILWSNRDAATWFELLEHHAVNDLADGVTLDDLVPAAQQLIQESWALDREVIDFDDMVTAPLTHKLRFWQADWVLVDEAQDTNAARRALALAMLKPVTGRLIAVGDDRQAIYGFTGADADALDLIKQELGSAALPLTVTYRCPKAVVREANRLVPDLVAHETAPEGVVRSMPLAVIPSNPNWLTIPWFVTEPPTPTSVVLCRNIKPLISQAYALLRGRVACRVEGREIGTGLIKLATRWKRVTGLAALADRLEDHEAREVAKWQAKGREERAQAVEDQCQCLQELIRALQAEGKRDVADLKAFIDGLFGDTPAGAVPNCLTLSTIHKSKGREWDTVYLLDRAGTLPSKWARKPWQLRQEANLEYVAITRAKRELVDLVVS